jgi:uncharacterized protein (DUF1810 family)
MTPEREAFQDLWHLKRFLDAQEPVYNRAQAELRAGAKVSHWMWYIFPQLKDLGRSPTADYFGIATIEEAEAYWQHAVLGSRLKECTELVIAVHGKTAHQIFGSPDDVKFRSCMTLFERAAQNEPVFGLALEKFFHGEHDALTLQLLN